MLIIRLLIRHWRSWVTKEQDQINEFKKIVAALSRNVKSKNDLGLTFIDKLSMQFDDHLAHQKIYRNESEKISGIKLLVTKLLLKLGLRNSKFTNTDPVIQNFIHELNKTGVITATQLKLLSTHEMISVDVDGLYCVLKPNEKDYKKAKLQTILLLTLTPLTIACVWEIAKCVYPGLPMAFILGAALGLLWRETYNLAWGRAKLAQYLMSRYPWFRVAVKY